MKYQDNRAVGLSSPFGKDVVVNALSGVERLSQPFQFDLTLYSDKPNLNADDILGKPVSVKLQTGQSQTRHFNGIVSRFSQGGWEQDLHVYYATLRPWFWFLSRTADCRIFQKKSVPNIVSDVCKDAGITAPTLKLNGTYDARDYCVQYRESDFDFLSRLLEQEGIFYFFKHTPDGHEMVLADDVGQLGTYSGYDKVPFYQPAAGAQRDRDHLNDWSVDKHFQAAKYATRDYDFEKASTELAAVATVSRKHDAAKYEVFDYPARTTALTPKGVEQVAKVRVQELQVGQTAARGKGDAVGLLPGHVFTLEKHPRDALNMRYLVSSTKTELTTGSYRGGGSGSDMTLSVEVEALDAREPFRPARTTPKPVIHGTQTAVVVGAKDAEIETDKYGRVRVQFHWDRYGKKNSDSSCWIRVATVWAGKNWGTSHIPRIGQEVVVSFLEGDPDQPIIIGSVPNNDQMPTYGLPTNKTRSGIMSRSSDKGAADNFNEIRFEDKKGSEEVYIHAEKDLNVVVENNQTISVGTTKKDKGDRKTTIQNDETTEIGGKELHKVAKGRKSEIKEDDESDVAKKYTLKAGDQITLECGQSKIVLKKDGTIEISGMKVKVSGTSNAEIDAPQTKVSGSKLEVSGAQTKVEGSGMLDLSSGGIATLKGSLTKIG